MVLLLIYHKQTNVSAVTWTQSKIIYFKTERLVLLSKVNNIYPPFSKLSKAKQCEVLLYGINLNNTLPDPRNRTITFAVQEFITKTNGFSKHYD